VPGCGSTSLRNAEELNSLGRQLAELRGEIDNSVQILAACAVHNPSPPVATAAAAGILTIIGPPDADELALASSLTADGVEAIVDRGLDLIKKHRQTRARYATARSRLISDYHLATGRASAFSFMKFITLAGGALFLILFIRKIF
jgi:hypothetical protein